MRYCVSFSVRISGVRWGENLGMFWDWGSVGRGNSVSIFSLSSILIILNLPHSLTFPSPTLTLPQHPMIGWYSCIIVNIEILTYKLFTFFSHNAYPTLRRVLQKFCFCHLDMYLYKVLIFNGLRFLKSKPLCIVNMYIMYS